MNLDKEYTPKELTKIKDQILYYLLNIGGGDMSTTVASELKMDHQLIVYMFAEFESTGFTEKLERMASTDSLPPRMILLNDAARKFLFIDGGYTRKYKKDKINDLWKITKTAASAVGTLAIIYLMWSANEANNQNKFLQHRLNFVEGNNEHLKESIELSRVLFDKLKLENDSLKMEVNKLKSLNSKPKMVKGIN